LFFSAIPEESKFHEDPENKNVFSIQYEKLTPSKNHLEFLNTSQKEYFAVSLFFYRFDRHGILHLLSK
jgi:hypothetical protein